MRFGGLPLNPRASQCVRPSSSCFSAYGAADRLFGRAGSRRSIRAAGRGRSSGPNPALKDQVDHRPARPGRKARPARKDRQDPKESQAPQDSKASAAKQVPRVRLGPPGRKAKQARKARRARRASRPERRDGRDGFRRASRPEKARRARWVPPDRTVTPDLPVPWACQTLRAFDATGDTFACEVNEIPCRVRIKPARRQPVAEILNLGTLTARSSSNLHSAKEEAMNRRNCNPALTSDVDDREDRV
jgi:hypothetical protein